MVLTNKNNSLFIFYFNKVFSGLMMLLSCVAGGYIMSNEFKARVGLIVGSDLSAATDDIKIQIGKTDGDEVIFDWKTADDEMVLSENLFVSGNLYFLSSGAKFDTASFMRLDQTIPQTVDHGQPIFKWGIEVPSKHGTYTCTNSPVIWDGHNCYASSNYSCIWVMQDNFSGTPAVFSDDGNVTPKNVGKLTGTQSVIYVYVAFLYGVAYVTAYTDVDAATFQTYLKSVTDPSTIVYDPGVGFNEAFRVDADTKEYINVMTLPICAPSGITTWTDPAVVDQTSLFIGDGLKVDGDTANITHNGDFTNLSTNATFRWHNKMVLGNGTIVASEYPLFVHQDITDFSIVGTIAGTLGYLCQLKADDHSTVTSSTASVFGGVWIDSDDATYNGGTVSIWGDVASVGGTGTVAKAIGVRTGLASQGGVKTFTEFVSFDSSFISRAVGGHQTITNAYQFKGLDLTGNTSYFTINNLYGLYIPDNSAYVSGMSWGIYSNEPKNYCYGMSTHKLFPMTDAVSAMQICESDGITPVVNFDTINDVMNYVWHPDFTDDNQIIDKKYADDLLGVVSTIQTSNTNATTIATISLDDNSTYHISFTVIGVQGGYSNRGSYEMRCTAYRNGGTASLQGTVSVVHSQESDGSWDVTVAPDGNDIKIYVTGSMANVDWKCSYTSIKL